MPLDTSIPLQFNVPEPVDYGAIKARKNAMAYQQAIMDKMAREADAETSLNNAFAGALGEDGQLDPSRLPTSLASMGAGAQIPTAMKGYYDAREAEYKAMQEQQKLALSVTTDMLNVLHRAKSSQDVIAKAQGLAQLYPQIAPQLAEALRGMPTDPVDFAKWNNQTQLDLIPAKDRLEKQLFQRETPQGQDVLAVPKYGDGSAMVVPGSQTGPKPKSQLVWTDQGLVRVNPSTGANAPIVAGGGRAHPALATNPGALKDGVFARSQPGYAGNNGAFAVFETPAAGVAAQEKLLRDNYIGKGFTTPAAIVGKYAPPGPENSAASVSNYAAYIAGKLGIGPNDTISAAQVPVLAKAMREFETGQTSGAGGQLQAKPTAGAAASKISPQDRKQMADAILQETGVDLVTGKDPVAPLIKNSTGGWAQHAASEALGAFNVTTEGTENIGRLEVIANSIVLAMSGGSLGAQISNSDRDFINAQLGKIQDPTVSTGRRLAAWAQVKQRLANILGVQVGKPQARSSGWGKARAR